MSAKTPRRSHTRETTVQTPGKAKELWRLSTLPPAVAPRPRPVAHRAPVLDYRCDACGRVALYRGRHAGAPWFLCNVHKGEALHRTRREGRRWINTVMAPETRSDADVRDEAEENAIGHRGVDAGE